MIASAFICIGPYAVLIMLGIKRVENRSVLPVPAKGRCAVGCSKSFCKEEYGNFLQWAAHALPEEEFERIPAWGDVKEWPGKIVGACDYEAWGRNDLRLEWDNAARSLIAPYQWDEGYAYWWDLSEVACFDQPIPCRGNVGMWQMPDPLAVQVTAAVDPGEMFREALKAGARSIVVAHNHPSGDLTPSLADIAMTAKLREAGNLLGVSLLDHLILGSDSKFAIVNTTKELSTWEMKGGKR